METEPQVNQAVPDGAAERNPMGDPTVGKFLEELKLSWDLFRQVTMCLDDGGGKVLQVLAEDEERATALQVHLPYAFKGARIVVAFYSIPESKEEPST